MKKVVLQVILIAILQESKLIHISEKILTLHDIIILIKSVANEQKVNYHNIFSERGSYKDKSNTE